MSQLRKPQNIFIAATTINALLRSVKKQHRFLKKHIHGILESAKASNDGSLDDSDFKKITHYYGLAVPAILGDAICALRGYSMTDKERLALTYQGAMTGLFDDFFDKFEMTDEQVLAFMEAPEKIKGSTSAENLFLIFYRNALIHAHNPILVSDYLRKVYQAQIESKKQAAPGLSIKEIKDITFEKGGVSVLFYRASMSHPFIEGEEDALYSIGGLMQFGNDIFDLYKDLNNNIHTLLTTTDHINSIRSQFKEQLEISFQKTKNLGYSLKMKKKYLQLISMSLCSRCFVCFDQLEAKEKQTQNIFMPKMYDRNDLVCDMTLLKNKLKTINYFLLNNNIESNFK